MNLPLDLYWERKWTKALASQLWMLANGAYVSEGEFQESLESAFLECSNYSPARWRLVLVALYLMSNRFSNQPLHVIREALTQATCLLGHDRQNLPPDEVTRYIDSVVSGCCEHLRDLPVPPPPAPAPTSPQSGPLPSGELF